VAVTKEKVTNHSGNKTILGSMEIRGGKMMETRARAKATKEKGVAAKERVKVGAMGGGKVSRDAGVLELGDARP
jgi:hypothetical protein